MRVPLRCLILPLVLASAASSAAPPPPVLVPEPFNRTIDGYDVPQLYQLWRHWLEAQKGAAAIALLAEPEQIEGERRWGAPLLEVTYGNDFGDYMAADLRLYCRPSGPYDIDRKGCHLRYRRAYVPHDAAPYQGENPLSNWMRENFDPARLVAHLRESGLPPQTDWWQVERARLFSTLPSPAQLLREHATIVRIDSRDCPRLAEAIRQLERTRLDWRLDFAGVGADQRPPPPAPHSGSVTYRLRTFTPNGGAAIEGWGQHMRELVRPIDNAIETCERPRAQNGE